MKKIKLIVFVLGSLLLLISCDSDSENVSEEIKNSTKFNINEKLSVSGKKMSIDKEKKIISGDVIYLHLDDYGKDLPSTRSSTMPTVDVRIEVGSFICGIDDWFFDECKLFKTTYDIFLRCDGEDRLFVEVGGFIIKPTKDFILSGIPRENAYCLVCSPSAWTFYVIE